MRTFSRAVLCAVLLSLLGISVVSLGAADAAAVPAVDSDIHISEVFADGGASSGTDSGFAHDFIELTNTGSQDETLTGWSLKDDTDSHSYPIDDGTVIPAGGYVAFNVDDTRNRQLRHRQGRRRGAGLRRLDAGRPVLVHRRGGRRQRLQPLLDRQRRLRGRGLHRHHPRRGERLPHGGGRPRDRQEPGQGQRGTRQRHRLGRRAATRRDRALQHGHDLGQPRRLVAQRRQGRRQGRPAGRAP